MLGLAVSLAICSLAGWLAVWMSPQIARHSVRVVFLALLAAFYFWSRWLPEAVWPGTVIAAILTIVFDVLLATRLRQVV